MTPRQFERINGHVPEVTQLHGPQGGKVFRVTVVCDCGPLHHMMSASARKEGDAFKKLAEYVYRHHCHLVDVRDQYKCSNCGSRSGLSHHHDDHRSKGRNDRVSNLKLRCGNCHDIEHTVKGGL